MLAIDVELLHGTIRAGSPDDLALTGLNDPGEWPPSPARLFAALVSAGTGEERWTFSDGSELLTLEQAGPPEIHCDGSTDVLTVHLKHRFVVRNLTHANTAQEYAGRTSESARPGARRCPKHPRVTYLWPSLDLPGPAFSALRHRVARVGYLGCADSPVRIRVHRALPDGSDLPAWIPRADGRSALPVAFDGLTQVLDDIFDDFSNRREKVPTGVRRAGYRTERAWYRDPSSPDRPADDIQPTVIWLRFDRAVAGRKILAITEALRDAVLSLYPAPREQMPDVLHGHVEAQKDEAYPQARYLALPFVGTPYADGRIHGAAVWLPPMSEPALVNGVRTALTRLQADGLWRRGRFATGVRIHAGEHSPWSCHPDRWSRPSRAWSSAFPVVHERWSRRGPTLDDAASWCEHAGLPRPIDLRTSRVPLLPGAVDLHPNEAFRADRERRPYSHIELRFDEPVEGPVVIGRSRSFGLGLMAPIADSSPAQENGRG